MPDPPAFPIIPERYPVPLHNRPRLQSDVPGYNVQLAFPACFPMKALAADDDAILAAHDMPASNPVVLHKTEGVGSPDCARNIVAVGTQATCAGNVVVNGRDLSGAGISETIALNGVTPVVGTKALVDVYDVTLPVRGAEGDQVKVGTGSALGLPVRLGQNTHLMSFHNGTRESTPPTVHTDKSQISLNTVQFNTAPDGNDFATYFLV